MYKPQAKVMAMLQSLITLPMITQPAMGTYQVLMLLPLLQVYSQIYNTTVSGNGGATALNYTSPVLHTVVLSGLNPDTKYFYQVGDGTTYSGTYNFTALADPSKLCTIIRRSVGRHHDGVLLEIERSSVHLSAH